MIFEYVALGSNAPIDSIVKNRWPSADTSYVRPPMLAPPKYYGRQAASSAVHHSTSRGPRTLISAP